MALQHLRSSTADKRPTPAVMSDGQLAMNTNLASPGLFLKDSNGDLVKVGPVHVGTTAPNATPGAGGQAGNSKGEQWLDTSSSRYVFKIWDGTDWRTEDGEFVNSSGDTMTGALVMDNQQQIRFRETTANGTNFIAIQAPASVVADRTLTLPDVTGTIVSTGDSGTVTSTMILDGTILNADVNDSAAIAGTKISPDFGSQNAVTTGTSTAASFIPTSSSVPANGIYLPAANSVGVATNSVERVEFGTSEVVFNDGGANYDFRIEGDTEANLVFVDASTDRVGIGTNLLGARLTVSSSVNTTIPLNTEGPGEAYSTGASAASSFVPTGTQLSVSSITSIAGNAALIDLGTKNAGDGFTNVYLGAVAGTGSNGPAHLVFGRRTAESTWSESARIDSSGRLLVGTSASVATGPLASLNQIVSNSQSEFLSCHLGFSGGGDASPVITLSKSRNTTYGSYTVVQNGDSLGRIRFVGDDGSDYASQAGLIECQVDGTPGTDDMPGRLVFSTTADGAAIPTERMRIGRGGTILVNCTSADPVGESLSQAAAFGPGASNGAFNYYNASDTCMKLGRGDNGTLVVFFRNQPSAVDVGNISVTTTATAYNTSSDYRLKENIAPIGDSITRLLQLKPSRFNFIADPDTVVDGFIAHEAAAVVPECVTGAKDAEDEDGAPIYQGIDQSKIVPLLTAALQEAIAKIETLEARLTAAGIA